VTSYDPAPGHVTRSPGTEDSHVPVTIAVSVGTNILRTVQRIGPSRLASHRGRGPVQCSEPESCITQIGLLYLSANQHDLPRSVEPTIKLSMVIAICCSAAPAGQRPASGATRA
jgi:hypothetical protein